MSDREHYEWTVIGPDGRTHWGVSTMGPSGPQDFIDNGTWTLDEDQFGNFLIDANGDDVMRQVTPPPPAGSYVARRVVTYGDWERADERLVPPSGGNQMEGRND